MKLQRFAVAITIINLALLAVQVIQSRSAEAHREATVSDGRTRESVASQKQSDQTDLTIAPVLRGRALEIIDDQGRVRAEIKVRPAVPDVKMPDGTTGYPESVDLRLIDTKGGPHVKLGATEDGSGLVLGGEKAYTQLLSRGTNPFIKIINKDGREQVIKP